MLLGWKLGHIPWLAHDNAWTEFSFNPLLSSRNRTPPPPNSTVYQCISTNCKRMRKWEKLKCVPLIGCARCEKRLCYLLKRFSLFAKRQLHFHQWMTQQHITGICDCLWLLVPEQKKPVMLLLLSVSENKLECQILSITRNIFEPHAGEYELQGGWVELL